jgi:Protein of unknown function (DUF2815)
MADKNTDGLFTLTAPVVLSHPHLFEAKPFMRKGKPAGEPKYGGSFVFELDSPDLKSIKALAVKLASAKWPGRDVIAESKGKVVTDEEGKQTRLSPTFKFPWALGDTIIAKRSAKLKAEGKEDDGKAAFQAGKAVIKTASKYAPRCAVLVNGKPTDLTAETVKAYMGQFYFGVKVLAQFNLVPYDKVGETGIDGVTIYLNMVLSLNKGEKLASGASAAETFKDYVGSTTDEDPTAGGEESQF